MSRPAEYETFTFPLLETPGTDQTQQGGSEGVVELEPQRASDSSSSNTQLSIVALPTPDAEIAMNSSHSNDQRGGEASVAGRSPDSLAISNINPQPPPNTTLSMSMAFPGLSSSNLGGGGGDPGTMTTQAPPPPPPRCQIMNPFLHTTPLAPLDGRTLQQQQAGSSLPMGQIGQLVQDNTVPNAFNQDLRHHRGYPSMTLPPTFPVHPNLQSQIQAFQQDMIQHGHMTQPPGFVQGFIPTEMNVASVVQQATETNTRTSHLLQPHVRQRARRRSRANRAIQHHAHHHHQQQHEGADPEAGTLGLRSRSMSEVPTARISVVEAGGGFGDTSVAAAGAAARLDDAKLKGLEENYSSIGENFECNICFQKANEAVVTCCGHLFCWPCLYRWLHIHSYHKECPVCKGAIDENSITPIYGRECNALLSARGGLPGGSAADRIPPRPPARRVESARQLREREDRGREREQRERAIAREQEREQQDGRGLSSDIQVVGSGTTLQIEEGGPVNMMRDGANDQAGQPTAGTGGEITSHDTSGNSNLEEIDQSEGPTQGNGGSGGGDGTTPSPTTAPTGVNNVSSGLQQDLRTGSGNGTSNTGPGFLQRRMSERREQLRAALAASVRNGMNSASVSSLNDRGDERRQMIAAAALLSQDWEDIVNISRMVGPVNPVQAAAWMTAMQGRLGGTEGTTTDNLSGDFTSNSSSGPREMVMHAPIRPSRPQHRIPQMLPMAMDVGISGAGGPEDSSLSRLVTVNPIQAGDWLAAMRSRLSNVEKIVENVETTPLQVFQQSTPGLLHMNHLLPAQSSSLHSGPLILGTVNPSTVANSESGPTPARRLVEEVFPNVQAPRACPSLIVEPPSTRNLEEQTVTAVVQPQPSRPEPSAGASGGDATPQSSHNSRTTTQADLRLHYREAPLSRPSSSRRRSSRMEDVTSTSDGTSVEAGTGGSGQETVRSRSKRRRTD